VAVGRSVPAAFKRRPALHPVAVLWTACLVAGLFLLGSYAWGMAHGVSEQHRLNQVWTYEAATRTAPRGIDPSLQRPANGVDFALRIPKLDYFAAVKEGVDSGVLYSSPGHYPSTMWPGNAGTVGVAAHNVYWINFPQLINGDEIDLETRYGLYRYRVVSSKIVNPNDRTVLVSNSGGHHLTMTTCWPLWAGAFATQRYVIFADQFWPVPVRSGYN